VGQKQVRVVMLHILGWVGIGILGVGLAVNGLFMLASPRAWFRLPDWLPGTGSMTEEKYGSGFGAIQTRVAGGLLLAIVLWVLYDALLSPR
jgi:hypothetical protein